MTGREMTDLRRPLRLILDQITDLVDPTNGVPLESIRENDQLRPDHGRPVPQPMDLAAASTSLPTLYVDLQMQGIGNGPPVHLGAGTTLDLEPRPRDTLPKRARCVMGLEQPGTSEEATR